MNPPSLRLKPTRDQAEADRITANAIKRDAEQAEREAMNCEQCPGLDKCKNSMKGFYAVIRKYPDRTQQPYLAVRKCMKNGG